MNVIEPGQIIAKLRKEAGYTQKSLADALFVSDKAVSKWERGICMPDSSLLTKLSMLLDSDIEYLISGNKPYGIHRWVGELRVDDIEGEVAGKPILFYLLSYFMLVGITDIYIKTEKKEYVNSLDLKQYGLNISFSPFKREKVMIVYEPVLLFGCNLTRYLQLFLFNNKNAIPTLDGHDVPIIFSLNSDFTLEWHRKKCERRPFGRGTILLPLNNDAESFIELYERNSGLKISDLAEIAKRRCLI